MFLRTPLMILLETRAVALAIASIGMGWIAFAQAQATSDADRFGKLMTRIADEIRAPYTADRRRSVSVAGEIDCEKARSGDLKESGRPTAAERHEAALLFRQCLDKRKAELTATYAPQLTALGVGIHPSLAADLIQQMMKPEFDNQELKIKDAAGKDNFMGMTFGLGVGVSFGKERITEADVAADNTLRATKREKQLPRVILEAHYYGVCEKRIAACDDATFGVGPFFGLAATNDLIQAFALGVMFGWKDKTVGANGGFSVGIGAVLDKEVKQLAPGFQEGAPLPAGETAPKFETRSKWSPLLFFTRTF